MANPLRRYREKHGLSQEALAKELGVSRETISMYEIGRRKPRPEMAVRIEETIGIDRAEFWPKLFRRRKAA